MGKRLLLLAAIMSTGLFLWHRCHLKERLVSSPASSLKENPFFFCLKPTSSFVQQPHPIRLPVEIESEFEHEVELGIIIGENAGRNIQPEYAMNTIAGYCLAIDLTARTLQNEAAKLGLPWSISKGFDTFCPVGYEWCFILSLENITQNKTSWIHKI